MLTWVVYDISSNRARTRVARRCLDAGLYRVQRSVFLGDLPADRADAVLAFSLSVIGETDSVYLFPMCRADFGRVRTAGARFDGGLVAGEMGVRVL